MKHSISIALSVALSVAAFAKSAPADEAFKPAAAACAGVYGAIADDGRILLAFFPDLASTNFGQVDFAGRHDKLLENEQTRADYMPSFTKYKTILTDAAINREPGPVHDVLALSVRCDQALGFKPSYSPANP